MELIKVRAGANWMPEDGPGGEGSRGYGVEGRTCCRSVFQVSGSKFQVVDLESGT